MATVAQWKDMKWEINSSMVKTIEDLSFSYELQAQKNSSTEEESETNEMGLKAFPLSFKTTLNSAVGIKVREEIDKWKDLISESGQFYINGVPLGPIIQLTKVSVSGVKLDNLGRFRIADLSFTFVEFGKDNSSSTDKEYLKPNKNQQAELIDSNVALDKAPSKMTSVGDYVFIGDSDTPAKVEEVKYKQMKVNGVWVSSDNISMA